MAIEINTLIGDFTNSVYSITGLNRLFSSIIYTSIILSVIVLIVLMFIYPCKKDTPGWVLLKVLLYVGLANIIILTIHSSIIKNNYKSQYMDKSVDNFMKNINKTGGIYSDESVKINPNLNNDDPDVPVTMETPKSNTIEELLDEVENKV